MRLTKRGNYWWVDFRTPDGRRRRVTTGETDRQAAERRAAEVVPEASKTRAPADPGLSLGAALERTYIEHWSKMKSEKAMRHTVNLLKREIGWRPLSEAQRRGEYGAVDVPHWTEPPPRERYMSEAEEADVFEWLVGKAAAEEHDPDGTGQWTYVHRLGVFLLDTGFRFSEALHFTLSDDGTRAKLAADVTKTRTARAVPLTARAQEAGRFLLGHPLTAQLARDKHAWEWADHRWRQATRACGCEDVTLHVLRHTCASRLGSAAWTSTP